MNKEKSKYPRGSEWRKWDLHIHSPLSICQNYGANKWNEFISALENLPEDVKVIGINDYYFIDGYEKVIYEKLNNNRLKNIEKIFPILEFRVDTFASASETNFQKVNLHILFNLDEDDIKGEINRVKKEFIEQIHLTKHPEHKTKILSKENLINESPDKNLQNGFKELIPYTDEVFELLESDTWKDKVFLFLGYKEWNNLDKGSQLKIFKKNLCNKVETFFSASKVDTFQKKNEILKEFGDKIILHSLDIHSFKDFDNYECYTWIKTDPTYEGLKQILFEKERVFIGDKPSKLKYVDQNNEYFIDSLEIFSDSNDNEWFDKINSEIKLNTGLISIIGNKGHGKSALSDILGSLVNYNTIEYSFLHPKRFLKFHRNGKYKAKILFKDNFSNTKLLSDTKFDSRKPIKAIYLSQNFVTNICEDIESSLLQSQIDDVIFSYVLEEEQLGYNNLRDLINHKTKLIEDKINKQKKKLEEINNDIVELESKKSKQVIEKIKKHLDEKKRQLSEHKSIRITKPKKQKGSTKSATIENVNKQIKKIQAELDSLQKELNQNLKEKEFLVGVKNEFQLIETNIKDSIKSHAANKVIKKYKINLQNDFTYNFNYSNLDNQVNNLNSNYIKINQEKKKLIEERKVLSEKLEIEQKELNKKDKEYKISLDAYKAWEKKTIEVIGAAETPDTIKYYENELNFILKKVDFSLNKKRDARKEIAKVLIDLLFEEKDIYPLIFQEAQEHAKTKAKEFNISDEFIDFDSKIKIKKSFEDDLYNFIDRRYTGSFLNDSKKEVLNEITNALPIQTRYEILSFAEKLEDIIKNDYKIPEESREELDYDILIYQFRNYSLKEFYDYIYSFDYIETKSEITFGGKRLEELSPGERGTLLLIFYLLIDPDKKPIIIDQPEENLDNETVFQKIVPFIKKIKEERQVIIVTHNPNLAIVSDSEQIIHAYMDKKNNNLVSYNSGSIEFYKIREKAIDILEGTEPAFVNRKKKYAIK